mmetsp:Transcript_16935/g.28595  ORF Transcript_16935/g.28595 Transcript_16935/m.28595 type:complete len:240 (-) Transcript_16935:146-865(-)
MGGDAHAMATDGRTPLHYAAVCGQMETVKALMAMGGSVLAQDADGRTPLHYAEINGHEAVVSFLRKNAKNKQRSKSTTVGSTAPIVDQAATAAPAVLSTAEEKDQKQSPPSKQGNSNKARTNRNRRKPNLDTGYKGRGETTGELEEGLVRLAVAGSSAQFQEQEPRSIEPPPLATLLLAIGSSENENTCVVCLAAPNSSWLLPCNHQVMCAECATAVLSSSGEPQCPVCRSRVIDCIYF